MIIIISLPVIMFFVGVWVVFSSICAAIFGIQNSLDADKLSWLKPFTVKQKWGLFALLLAIFGGVGAFLYGWFYHNGYAGLFGCLGAIAASVAAAYICSPLKWDWESAAHPLGVISSLASLLVIVAFAWVFLLIGIFRKSTWRLYVGIVVALALFFAGAAGGLVIYENVERNERLELAQSYIASAEYEKAMQVYQNLDEEELYLQTKYNYGIWYLEQNEFYKSREIFRELAEVEYSDAALKILQVNYAWGVDCEEKGDLTTAAGIYEDILDYEDARQRYQHCCYALGCKDAERLAGWEHAAEWFQKAGDYQDASQLAIYYQARILGQENLLEAENLLRQLPRDFLDVDTMLTAIENYRDWNGTYSLTKSSGKDPKNYQKAELVLVYHRLTSPADAHIKWKVVCYLGNKGYTQYSGGETPKNGTLKFNVGETYEYHFSITQKKIEMVTLEPYGNYTDDKKEHTYIFEAIN